MKTAFLVDRQLFFRHAAKNFRRGADVSYGARMSLPKRVEHTGRTLNISLVGIKRRFKAGTREALRREVEDEIGCRLAYDILNRERVAQITVEKGTSLAAVGPATDRFEVVQRAAPPDHAVTIPICIRNQQFSP